MNTTNDHIQLPFTTSHAFVVGINTYQHLTPLSTAVNDARVIAQRLEDQHGFTVHPPLLDATHAQLRKLLTEDIPRLVGKDDRVLFYFAGHGIALDSEEGPNGYLVAADTRPGKENTLIAMQTLHDALTGLPCRHGLLILDCCFSGAFKWSSGYRDVLFDLPKIIYEERFWRYCKDEAWQVITSSAHDQKAVDIITNQSLGLREEGRGQHSPFARLLLEALSGAGDTIPAESGDGVITATELYTYLRETVEQETTTHAKRQSPSFFNLRRHDKGEFVFLHPNHRFNLPPTPDRNPFMGLAAYSEEDSHLFYGRDRVVTALLNQVTRQRMTVVSGASGTGKSSVIKAGVLPQLRKQGHTILPIIRPGREPMQVLAETLPEIDRQLKTNSTFLVIDQYEELITQCLQEAERAAFEQQLADWLTQHANLYLIISIRADFEPQFENSALTPWWQAGRYIVPAFSLEEIREVITKPASQAVLFYEPDDLVERLNEEVSQAPGALPLLSFTLSELYHAYLKSGRADRALTEGDYNQLGGVIGALRTRADAEYQQLDPVAQSSMRKLMLRMASLEGGELAGKRVYAAELHFSDSAETQRLETIADQLVAARLLLKGTDNQGRTYIEPAHDALVRAWARLWEWVKAVGEEKITLQYRLSQAVNDYYSLLNDHPKKARNLLWNNNPRLDLLRLELGGHEHGLNAREEAFVRSSVKRRSTRQRINWGIAFAVMIGLAGLALTALNQQRLAEQERDQATANSLASQAIVIEQTNPTVAVRVAELALATQPDNINALGALLNAYYVEERPAKEYFYQLEKKRSPISDAALREARRKTEDKFRDKGSRVFFSEWADLYTPTPDGSILLMLYKSNGELTNFEVILQSCFPETFQFTYNINHGNFRNPDLEFHPTSFTPDDMQLLIPNGNQAELWKRIHLSDWKKEHVFSAPHPIRWAVFDINQKQVIARTTPEHYYTWQLSTTLPRLTTNSWRKNIRRVFYDPEKESFLYLTKEDKPAEIDPRNGEGPAQDKLDLSTYTELFNIDDYAIRSEESQRLYSVTIQEDTRAILIEKKATEETLLLSGHLGLPVSVSFDPAGRFIVSSSMGETKFWDWQGNNFYSLDYGGLTQILPDGKAICFWEYESQGSFTSIYLMDIDPKRLHEQLDALGVPLLTDAEKDRLIKQ